MVVRRQPNANNGDIVAALVGDRRGDGQATSDAKTASDPDRREPRLRADGVHRRCRDPRRVVAPCSDASSRSAQRSAEHRSSPAVDPDPVFVNFDDQRSPRGTRRSPWHPSTRRCAGRNAAPRHRSRKPASPLRRAPTPAGRSGCDETIVANSTLVRSGKWGSPSTIGPDCSTRPVAIVDEQPPRGDCRPDRVGADTRQRPVIRRRQASDRTKEGPHDAVLSDSHRPLPDRRLHPEVGARNQPEFDSVRGRRNADRCRTSRPRDPSAFQYSMRTTIRLDRRHHQDAVGADPGRRSHQAAIWAGAGSNGRARPRSRCRDHASSRSPSGSSCERSSAPSAAVRHHHATRIQRQGGGPCRRRSADASPAPWWHPDRLFPRRRSGHSPLHDTRQLPVPGRLSGGPAEARGQRRSPLPASPASSMRSKRASIRPAEQVSGVEAHGRQRAAWAGSPAPLRAWVDAGPLGRRGVGEP